MSEILTEFPLLVMIPLLRVSKSCCCFFSSFKLMSGLSFESSLSCEFTWKWKNLGLNYWRSSWEITGGQWRSIILILKVNYERSLKVQFRVLKVRVSKDPFSSPVIMIHHGVPAPSAITVSGAQAVSASAANGIPEERICWRNSPQKLWHLFKNVYLP